MKKTRLSTAAIAAFAVAGSANAAIVTGELTGGSAFNNGGVFQEFTPTTVGNNHQQSNNLFAFNENQAVALAADVGGVTAGTVVDSHYVFFDPGPSRRGIGYVDFNSEILGVLITRADMDATDALLGLGSVNYVSVNLRGLENADSFNVVGNRLNIDWTASRPGDYVRVLTATAVPEPASWAMLIGGFGLVGGAMRRRRKMTTNVSYA